MARRLRCPCGNLVPLPDDARAGTKVGCTACNRTISVPASKPAAASAAPPAKPATASKASVTVRPGAAPKPAGVKPAGNPAKSTLNISKNRSDPSTPVPRKKTPPPRKSRGPLIATLAVLLLAGGGVGAYFAFKDKGDKPKPVAQKPPTDAKDKDQKPNSNKDDKLVKPASSLVFSLAVEQSRGEVSPGAPPVELTVRTMRPSGMTADIVLNVKDLPPGVTATPVGATAPPAEVKLTEKQDAIVLQLNLPPNVKLGSYRAMVEGKAKDGDREFKTETGAPSELEIVAPFDLKVDTKETVAVPQGTETVLPIKVTRKGGYEGPIALEFKDLPSGVKPAEKAEVPGKESAAMIKLTAEKDALLVPDKRVVSVTGSLPGNPEHKITAKFNLSVTESSAKAPFDLKIDPTSVKLPRGGEVVVKAVVKRNNYDGPIKVEFKKLPDKVKADPVDIPVGLNSADVKLTAAPDAVAKDYTDVYASGTTTDAAAKPVLSAPIVLKVTAPFTLAGDPNTKILPGGKASIKITATRTEYMGPIDVVLMKLPDGVKMAMPKVTIAKDQTSAQVDLMADDKAVPFKESGVYAEGTATDDGNKKVTSDPFTVEIANAAALFEFKLDPSPVRVPQGGMVPMTVTIVRKDYMGAITLDFNKLQDKVTAMPATIAKGDTTAMVMLSATPDAVLGDNMNVTLTGTAVEAPNGKVESAKFTVTVVPAQSIDLKIVNAPIFIRQGTTVQVQVSATRNGGYDGPINVQLRNLPALVTADMQTIPQGQTTANINLTADPAAPRGIAPKVVAVATASALGTKEFLSSNFVITTQGPAMFTLVCTPPVVTILQGNTGVPGSTGSIRITAVRTDYDGPITLTLQNLPAQVTTLQQSLQQTLTINQGTTTIDVPLVTKPNTPLITVNNVSAVGAAPSVGLVNITSANITVTVAPKTPPPVGGFTLKVDHLKLKRNASGHLTVHVIRTGGFTGAVNITSVNGAPGGLTFNLPVTIPAGAKSATIPVSAANAAIAKSTTVTVVGSSADNTIKNQNSPAFEIDVTK